jgi:hypothetical protein
MPNTRVYYGNSAIFIKGLPDSGEYNFIHGVQSMSDSFTNDLVSVQEFGQTEPYEIIENLAEGTVQLEKVMDGCVPIYLLATEQSAASAGLAGRQDSTCVVAAAIYSSSASYVSGTPNRVIEFSGLSVNSIAYEFNVDGACRETVGLIGNYRTVSLAGTYGTFPSNPTSSGNDEPCALTSCSGGIQNKENVMFTGTYPTLLPPDIPGITSSGTMIMSNGCPTTPIQSISVNCDLSREAVYQLGCRGAYARYVQFPVDVTCEIVVLSQSGDNVNISEQGSLDGCDYTNAPARRIRVSLTDGLRVDLGDKMKLSSINTQWGNADGGNTTYTLSYTGKSVLSVFHPNDPAGFVYAGTW